MSWFRRFMQGRYGTDQLSIGLLVVLFLISLLGRLFQLGKIIDILYVLVAFFIFYRVFSKNTAKRYQENIKFLKFWHLLKNKLLNNIKLIRDARYYRYYKCANCGQKLRVPKGKGKIAITCPKCKTSMIRKS